MTWSGSPACAVTRAFLRDVLGWKYVAEDWDNDWLIFKSAGAPEMYYALVFTSYQ